MTMILSVTKDDIIKLNASDIDFEYSDVFGLLILNKPKGEIEISNQKDYEKSFKTFK